MSLVQAVANVLLAKNVPIGNTVIDDDGSILWDSTGYEQPVVTDEEIQAELQRLAGVVYTQRDVIAELQLQIDLLIEIVGGLTNV